MLKNQSVPNQSIINCLKADYGIEVATLKFLPLGADMDASVYKAQTDDMRCYFIKLKRDYNFHISAAVAKLLYESRIQQVIFPIKTTHGEQSECIGDSTLIVYPFIEGQDGFSRDLTKDQWRMLGNALRQVHEIKVPLVIQNKIEQKHILRAGERPLDRFLRILMLHLTEMSWL